ncbi:hypothetical protein L1987_65102 [Smallanthus sonchifolius]|uniref:Uncharacterized protein n=1 Tax=Smallanthus sonchifolius TaxID=185202 RepID=A0ACB9BTQ9_9ASTR|nr:hypothetical protein L1987_65102 [Smallanthus sonchifolius]
MAATILASQALLFLGSDKVLRSDFLDSGFKLSGLLGLQFFLFLFTIQGDCLSRRPGGALSSLFLGCQE